MIQVIFTAAKAASDRRTKALTALQAAWPDFLARTAKTIGDLGYTSVLFTTEALPFKGCTKTIIDMDIWSNYGFRIFSDGGLCPCEAESSGYERLNYVNLDALAEPPLRVGIVHAIESIMEGIKGLSDKADKQAHEAESILGALPPVQQ